MRTLATAVLCILSASISQAQHGLPQEVEQTLSRLEIVFNSGNTRELKWVLPSAIRMRIEDSVYAIITDIYVMKILHSYLAGKDSREFKFTGALISEVDGRHTSGVMPDLRMFGRGKGKEPLYIATGKLNFMGNGMPASVVVTVYIAAGIVGIDISQKPRGAAFFISPYN